MSAAERASPEQAILAALDNARLASETVVSTVRELRARVGVESAERHTLEARLEQVIREQRRLSEDYVALETHVAALANLYVATHRLLMSLEWVDVVQAIQEIVTNIIGSEESGIYEMIPGGNSLSLVSSFGIDRAAWQLVPADRRPFSEALSTGEVWVADKGSDSPISVCIPLRHHAKVTGAIAIFRLLPQKLGIEAADRELFDVLSTHAASALFAARGQDRRAQTLRP